MKDAARRDIPKKGNEQVDQVRQQTAEGAPSGAILVNLPLKRIDAGMPLPTYAHDGDAGLDLRSTKNITLDPGRRALIPTGIAMAIPEGYAGFVLPRSGLALREGLSLVNSPGLIDSHYRGEVRVVAINLDSEIPIHIRRGDRVAQLVIQPVHRVAITEVTELEQTARGERGFGSTDAR